MLENQLPQTNQVLTRDEVEALLSRMEGVTKLMAGLERLGSGWKD